MRLAQQSGYILLPVIVVITLVAAIALLMNTESALESNTAASELDAQQAQYVAAAGLNHAQWLARQQGCGPYTNLTAQTLGNDSYSASLTTDLGTTSAYSAGVEQDDGIVSSLPDTNNGGSVTINIAFDGVDEERMLTRFDISALPANAGIVSAQARFYVEVGHAAGAIDLHQVVSDWSESDATWNTMNDRFATAVFASIPPQAVSGVWVSVNITSLVQAWVNGEPNYGVMLKSATPNINARYSSRESANPPVLEVVVGTPPSSPATLSATGTLGNGVSRQLLRDDIELVQQPGYLQLQPGPAAGKDNYLYEWKSTWNYGISDRIWVDDRFNDSTANGLIHFDLAAVPAGARVISARLELYQANTSIDGGPIGIYRVVADWEEGTNSGGIGTANWTERDAGNSWLNAGADFGTTRYALETVPYGLGWSSWEIGELVDGWVSGRIMNHGLALYAESFGSAGHFASSDDTDPTLRPKLSVTYTCTCDEVCVAPQGEGNILMVVVNPTTLEPEDQKAKDLFESWGYTVNVISESANQTLYDAGFAANDVVFISETVNATQVGAKTASAPIGVVSQDGDYNPDLGLASGSAHPVGDSINITDNSHYITRPFASGSLDIYTDAMEQLTSSGSLNADQQQLADSGGVAALIALDKNATMEGSGSAAGRRVMLPLGTRYRFDWDRLNANGRLLVQRALAWGAGADVTSAGEVLMVVPDPSALDTRDTARKALIESWDYAVALIDDDDPQNDFDAALADAGVVYVGSTASDTAIGDKLTNTDVGVVIEVKKLADNFGMAPNTENGTNATAIEVVNNTHYITEVFATGPLTILDSLQEIDPLSGTFAPDLVVLDQIAGSQASLVALDGGGMRTDATPSPGRRVKLPWGSANLDFSLLNADAQTLLQRALEWAASTAAASCDADYTPDTKLSEFSTSAYGSNNLQGLTYFPAGKSFNGVAAPAGGAWISVNYADGRFYMTDTAGNYLTDLAPPVGAPTGVAYVASGTWADHLAVIAQSVGEIQYYDLGGTLAGSFSTTALGSAVPTGVTFIGATAGSVYDDHLAISDSNADMVFLVTQDGTLVSSFDTSSFSLKTNDLAHLPGSDKLLLIDWNAIVFTVDFSGTLLGQYDVASFGSTVPEGIAINPVTCDHVVGDDTPNLVVTLNQTGGDNNGPYVEAYQPWTANNDNVWEVVDLAAFGVPPNAVVEVAVINADSVRERSGGVRAVGSALDRQLILHEAESGGSDVMIMHVQANAASQIEHYVESRTRVSFILLGYWTSGSFVESWNDFAAAGSFSWGSVALSGYGVPPGAIVEVLMHNDNNDAQFRGGVRTPGSAAQRLINLHEAESGGNEIATMLVTAGSDASATIEVYSESVGDVDFYLSGYWDNPPGVFTETFSEIAGLPAGSSSWEDASLAAFGVPADAVVSIMLANSQDSAEAQLGVRRKGSSLARSLELQEAEPNGDDLGSMHALTDGSSIIQLYDQNTTQNHRFYLMGWWQTSP